MANPVSSVDVPLSLFSGWNTELSPPDQPEGASPANNDVIFLPGTVATRPGLNRVFASPISSLGPFTYEKSFVTPSGTIKNLYLTGDGILWVEDVTNSPGVAVKLFTTSGATYASSCTAFGREYIALSDGVHGQDIPLQYDGTNLWRVSQDGPGAPPVVTSFALPSTTMAVAGSGAAQTINSISTTNFIIHAGFSYYAAFTVFLAVGSTVPAVSQLVTIAGNTQSIFNGTWTVLYTGTNNFTVSFYSTTNLTGTGGTATSSGGITLQRQSNTVSATSSSPHGLLVGYQVQIQNAGSTVVGGTISSIVLNNEDTPGIATVTTTSPHGLLPNNQVNITGVTGVTVGTGITNVAFAGNLVTITTSAAHGLSIGSEVIVTAVTNTTVNGQWVVASIPSPTTFTYAFVSIITAYSAADTGTVKYLWPLANVNPAQNYFTVQTAPSPTTFTIALSYTDGTWTGGTVSFPWDGIFYVTAVPSTTTFQYRQYGPNATTTTVGTITPYGQITPGIHQCQQAFLLASGAITQPSPPATFVANGGQYLNIAELAIGPINVVARILLFTGAGGAYFFYIPVPAQINGITVSTATQINDNTTSSVVVDFSDNTLYAAIATSIPGNNLAAQVVLGPCAGMFTYASRLLAWGERNKINNLLNMAFDGGYLPGNTGQPLGWVVNQLYAQGAVVSGRIGSAWEVTVPFGSTAQWGQISQSAFRDAYGAPIVLPNQQYSVRVWLKDNGVPESGGNVFIELTSASTSFTATVEIPTTSITTTGGYFLLPFSAAMPATIPSDLQLTYFVNTSSLQSSPLYTVTADELEIIYTNQPYLNNISRISYAENPEAFDSLTGVMGPEDDLSPIRNFGVIRQALYIVTGTGLHETQDNDQTEPSGWTVAQVADNCGAFSVASVARNAQGIGSAFKDSMIWSGPDGAQLFTGQTPFKVSQEIQSVWDAIPAASSYQCWVKNYENAKWCFFGIPIGNSMQVLVLDYRNIDGARIPENPPIHISFTGKMIVSDLTRKWTVWNIPAFCGELMYRNSVAQPQIVFGCKTPSGSANSYILNPLQYHDDDFGTIFSSYTTYFFVSHEMEQALQVLSHRHTYKLSAAFISGVGTWSITPLAASLNNPFPSSADYPLSLDPLFDMDFGINVETTRCAFQIQATPLQGSMDAYFKLQKLVINMSLAPWAGVRGSASGRF